MAELAPAPFKPINRASNQGMYDAATLPRPIKKLCIEKPSGRCSFGSMSATNARNGSMLTFMEASRIQRRPAAMHKAPLKGIKMSAIELRIAPVKKKRRRRPNLPQVLSLHWPITGCTSKPVSGAASHRIGS